MVDFECMFVDFRRGVKIFITRKVDGQYYYGVVDANSQIEWKRQCHEDEVKPFLILEKSKAQKMAQCILDA